LGGATHEREDGSAFFAGHDHRDVDRLVGIHGLATARQRLVEDALVEEHQGIHRLVLGRSSDVSVHGQVSEERFDRGVSGEAVVARRPGSGEISV
jgi:hypothetical protein